MENNLVNEINEIKSESNLTTNLSWIFNEKDEQPTFEMLDREFEALTKNKNFLEKEIVEIRKGLPVSSEITKKEKCLNLVLRLIDLNRFLVSSRQKNHKKEEVFKIFSEYFSFSNISRRAMELAFGSTINAAILFLLTPFFTLFSKLFFNKKKDQG